ncbi:hypothetical protein OOU_Y34scaffold00804g3 [Pyricularia oryzae Y34]|uniref:Uncharacterized protein n=1 Tax=Pyricularia oryzae (strain Y34) TaxID=1143189 RepID=A0AA97PGV1_PYRO3|nr:hypothetical protein OOU_Y34scaffold00804g3 [Pyricularia oryzae Y34]
MAKTRERDKKLANRKDDDKKEEGTAAQRQLKRTARDIRRFFEQADASLEQNLIPFLDELAPDVNFAADQAEQMSPYPIEWSGSAKKFAAAEKKFRKSAEKAGYKVPEDSGVRIKFSDQEAKKAPEPKATKKIATIEEDLEMRDATNEEEGSPEDSSADDSSEEQDNIWPLLFKRVSTQNMHTPAWRALQQDCKLRGCDFVDVKFRLEFLLAHENPDETPNGLLRSARKWIETCPGALELLEDGFYGDQKMSKRFSAYRRKYPRTNTKSMVGSRTSRLTSEDPEADLRERTFIDRTKPHGNVQITLAYDPDRCDKRSVKGTIVLDISFYLAVQLKSLNTEHPQAKRYVLVKKSDYREQAYQCPVSIIGKSRDASSLSGKKLSEVVVAFFASAPDENAQRWPRTYVVGYFKNDSPDVPFYVWSRSVFRTKFGAGVDEEINAARKKCGQLEIRKR